MRNILLITAVLAMAAPVFAAVTITATQGTPSFTNGTWLVPVAVRYTAESADAVSAFALVLTVDSGMHLDNIRDFNRGESNRPGGGYGIFPGKFRQYINPLNGRDVNSTGGYGWADGNYNPLAPPDEANGISGNDTPRMVVELGTLYQEANYPGALGTLFTVDINSEQYLGDCNFCVAVEPIRGGVVGKDGNTISGVTVPGCIKIPLGGCLGCIGMPNCIGLTRGQCCALLTNMGFTCGVEANVAPTAAGQTVGTIIGQRPAPGTIIAAGTPMDVNVVSYPIKAMTAANSLYVNWVFNGRPACWAYPRQCHGDADGKKQLTNWVSGNDLYILRSCIMKNPLPSGCSCSNFDHKKELVFWCGNNDLAILRLYIAKLESQVPLCGNIPLSSKGFSTDPNFWYWCIPTGAVCPTGQYWLLSRFARIRRS